VGSEGSLSDEQESSQRGVFALRIPARGYSTAGRSCQEYSSRSGEKWYKCYTKRIPLLTGDREQEKGSRARKIHTFLLYGFVFVTADGNRKVGTRGGGGGMLGWACNCVPVCMCESRVYTAANSTVSIHKSNCTRNMKYLYNYDMSYSLFQLSLLTCSQIASSCHRITSSKDPNLTSLRP
jgi:hypothetical protein